MVDAKPLDASVVRQLATRDGVSEDVARAQAIETLQLAAGSRAAHAQQQYSDPRPQIAATRRQHLLRAARARLWLDEDFASPRTPAAIPDDDPILGRALSSSSYVHPRVHRICQVVVIPADAKNMTEAELITRDPAWRARAMSVLSPLAARIQRYIPASDPEACGLIGRSMSVLRPETVDEDLLLRFESQLAFDLTACAEVADDGRCVKPNFDPMWTERIGTLDPGTYSEVFAGSWGLHFASLVAIEPLRDLADPSTSVLIREQIHLKWLVREFANYMEALQRDSAVRVAALPAAAQEPEAR
ncbi:MAG: hypothetical protein JKY37_06220 [Nannocystaceae bacterium]|nr:hypothetical protein [Nannocystaceae bacterium]